jgi:hypothetical protein
VITFDLLITRVTTYHIDLFGGHPNAWAWVDGCLVIASCVDGTNETELTVYSSRSVTEWIEKANALLSVYGDDDEGVYDAIVHATPVAECLNTQTV